MSVTWPGFVFPSPGLIQLPLPESTKGPAPYDQSLGRMLQYLDSTVRYSSTDPDEGFGSTASSIRVNDVIEPRWTEPDTESDSTTSEWVLGLRMCCLVCLPTEGEKLGSSWCDHDTSDALSVDSYVGSDDGVRPGGADVQMRVPMLGSESSLANASLACTIGMYLSSEKAGLEAGTQPIIMSQLFMASNTPRTTALNLIETKLYIYNETYPLGYQNATVLDDLFPSDYPTATARPRVQISCIPSRVDDCRRDGWYKWPIGKRVGIVIGALAGTIFVLFLIWSCCRRTKYSNIREKKTPILLSELRAQRNEEDRGHFARERERQETAAQSAAARERDEGEGEGGVEKPPPSYHETVNDQERMLADCAIRRDNANVIVPPPEYGQTASARSTSLPVSERLSSQSTLAASSSRPARPAYP
jgi:hypothetical protein